MNVQRMENDATWAKPPVLPVTQFAVSTPLSKRQGIAFGAKLAKYSSIEDLATFFRQSQDSPVFDPVVCEVEVPAIIPIKSVHEGALATVIQIWEGVVISVDHNRSIMSVKLIDRGNLIGEHTADIELQWVADQDRDLLRPGAVFYWTLYKETKKGSVSNSQEIRFRRLPNWNKTKLAIMQEDARELSEKFSKSTRIAD